MIHPVLPAIRLQFSERTTPTIVPIQLDLEEYAPVDELLSFSAQRNKQKNFNKANRNLAGRKPDEKDTIRLATRFEYSPTLQTPFNSLVWINHVER
ncbi:MAG TPA: hypothetical protein VKP58_14060 [Candidatus Acidoferrum sp.]|jgi:hypothetical protein|nr:hypothetical protein [Candidatus Acidoferrum sp.]